MRFAAALASALACLAEPVFTPGCANKSLSNQSPMPALASAFIAFLVPRSISIGFCGASFSASFAAALSLVRTAAASASASRSESSSSSSSPAPRAVRCAPTPSALPFFCSASNLVPRFLCLVLYSS